MSKYLKIAIRFYQWIAIISLTGYIIYIIYDDYIFIEKISSLSDLGTFLLFQFLYLIAFFLGFSFYYWMISLFVIFGCITIQRLRTGKD
ncbi:MAG: hypothetical protein C0490_03115 [Marivirga sp.]|nr:hypothetical protein [Marivirga sp.]